jgi:hypothetical protein
MRTKSQQFPPFPLYSSLRASEFRGLLRLRLAEVSGSPGLFSGPQASSWFWFGGRLVDWQIGSGLVVLDAVEKGPRAKGSEVRFRRD